MYSLFARLYSLQTLFDYCYVLGCDDRLDHVFHLSKHKYKKSRKTLILRDLLLLFRHLSLTLSGETGFEPTTLTAYISATLLSKFQIGNETVTIFRCWVCPTLTAVCLPNFRVQRYGFLLKLANI